MPYRRHPAYAEHVQYGADPAVVSQTAHDADPSGGKGEEVSPVARDNHGAEVRAEKQSPPSTTATGPGNSDGHANPNSDNASDHANGKP